MKSIIIEKEDLGRLVSSMKIKLFLVCIFLHFILPQSFSGFIKEIEVNGNDYFSDFEVIYFADLKTNQEINDYIIQERISRIWDRGFFSQVDMETYNLGSKDLKLIISVKEKPQINSINFSGNKKKSSESILKEINLQKGQLFSNHECYLVIDKIKALYSENNFNDVSVSYRIEPTEKSVDNKALNRVDLFFEISEGVKTKVSNIIYSGNQSFSDFKLTRAMKEIKPLRWYTPWNGEYSDDKISLSKENIYKYYKDRGYYDFEIINFVLHKNGKKSSINIDLNEGNKYYFRNFVWKGNYLFKTEILQDLLGFYSGDIYEKEKFELAIYESVVPIYMDKGYFNFMIDPQITPIGLDSLDVIFNIQENDIVFINKIEIIGNYKTDENVIRRELDIFPGDIFNRKLLIDSVRDLFMLNYFENIIPDVKQIDANHVNIVIDVIEKSIGQANFTMGYNGMYGFTGGGGFEFPNLFGGGQNVAIQYQRGLNNSSTLYQTGSTTNPSSYQTFNFNYIEPRLFDTPNLIGFSIFYTEQGPGTGSYTPFDVTTKGASIRFGRRFKFPDRYFRGSWSIRISESAYYSESVSAFYPYYGSDISTTFKDGQYIYNSGGISVTQTIDRDDRDHPEFPSNGSKINLTSTYSKSIINQGQDYIKNIFSVANYTSLYNKLVLNQNFKTGVIGSLSDYQIPYYSRFFMGGTGMPYGEMLRGYELNSIGPYESRSLGGNILLKFSLELRLSLSESPTIFVFLFADAGNVWRDFDTIDPYDLKKSIGIGGRIFVPMLGMLGYDIGYGFDVVGNENSIHGLEYHFVFGMPFN